MPEINNDNLYKAVGRFVVEFESCFNWLLFLNNFAADFQESFSLEKFNLEKNNGYEPSIELMQKNLTTAYEEGVLSQEKYQLSKLVLDIFKKITDIRHDIIHSTARVFDSVSGNFSEEALNPEIFEAFKSKNKKLISITINRIDELSLLCRIIKHSWQCVSVALQEKDYVMINEKCFADLKMQQTICFP